MKNKKSYAEKLIPIIILAVVLYTVVSFILQFTVGIEPSPTLTTCYFSFWAIELVNLAVIKVKKPKKRESSIEPLGTDKEEE